MTPLFKKLQFKGQDPIAILNAPDSFGEEMTSLRGLTHIDTEWKTGQTYEFILIFVLSQEAIQQQADMLMDHLNTDALLWFAYPKKSSKAYKTDISRDSGWQPLGDLGFEGVRMVAIDADWSALRLRNARFIKQMKRSSQWAMSAEGRKRTQKEET